MTVAFTQSRVTEALATDAEVAAAEARFLSFGEPPHAPATADDDLSSRKLRTLDLRHMIATAPEPVSWTVDRIVARGALTLLAGVAGEGKSLLAMAWALAAAGSARPLVAGMTVASGPVVVVDAENGPREIHRRVHALGISADVVERLHIIEADGFDLVADLAELERVLAACKPSYLVLDSFRSLWRGDERDEAQVAAVLDPLRNLIPRHNAGTVLIHHARRDGSAYRGSGAIAASCELAFLLNRAESDPEQGRRQLRCEKSRPAAEPAPRWLQLASESELTAGEPLITEAEPFKASGRGSVTRSLAAEVVEAIRASGPLFRADFARRLGREPNDGTVRRAFAQAVDDGLLVALPGGAYDVANTDGNLTRDPAIGVASLPGV